MLLLGIVVAILVFAAIIVYSSFSWGFVLFKFWYWFLLPVFTTLPHIDYWHAIGLMFIIGLFNKVVPKTPIKDEFLETDQNVTVGVVTVLLPWICLTIGFFIKLIIG